MPNYKPVEEMSNEQLLLEYYYGGMRKGINQALGQLSDGEYWRRIAEVKKEILKRMANAKI